MLGLNTEENHAS